MVIGSKMALSGELEVGAFSVLVFLTQRFLWPFTTLGETVDLFERSMASTKRILDLAKNLCNGKVVSILEGGYDLNALKESVDYHVKSLME